MTVRRTVLIFLKFFQKKRNQNKKHIVYTAVVKKQSPKNKRKALRRNKMKKILAFALAALMLVAFTACGTKEPAADPVKPLDATATFTSIWNAVSDDFKFYAIGGSFEGNAENGTLVDGAPGKFDFTTENANDLFENSYNIPATLVGDVDNASTLMHGMFANGFTGLVISFKTPEALASGTETIKNHIPSKPYMCGIPEGYIIMNLGGNAIFVAVGGVDVLNAFETATTTAVEGATVVAEGNIH